MDRKQYFEELHIALTREGFTSQPKQGELLPVEWGGLPLCRITADGGVRYWQEDVATPERERACERATDLACTVREYMTLLEQAPPLQAQSLTGDYRLLADFNGAVLAAHPTRRCQAGLRHPRRPHFQTANLQSGAAYRNLPVLL